MTKLICLLCLLGALVTVLSAQSAETRATGKVVIGCIGDSITSGMGASAQVPACAQLPKFLNKCGVLTVAYSSVNLGASGTTTTDWAPPGSTLRNAITAMTAAKVNVVQIMLGTNDAKRGVYTSASVYSTNLRAVIMALKAAGFQKIILHQPIYISQAAGEWDLVTSNSLIVQYGKAITGIAAADPTYVFDGDHLGYAWFQTNTADSLDGIHPNDNGHVSLGFLWAMAYRNLFLSNAGVGSRETPRNPQ